MNVPEYIGKELLAQGGLKVPAGLVATSSEGASAAAQRIGGRVVVKAQVAAGKRGKGGGIRFAADVEEARVAASELLGSRVSGYPVDAVLVEGAVPIAREFYAAVMNDPASRAARLLFSTAGGMDIEEVPAEKIVQAVIDIRGPFALEEAQSLVARTDAGTRQRDRGRAAR